jgi:hypothetical protein
MYPTNASAPETQLRELLESRAEVVRARHIEGVLTSLARQRHLRHAASGAMARHAEVQAIVGADLRPLPTRRGIFEITEMDIAASGDLAYGCGLLKAGTEVDSFPVRLTGVPAPYRRRVDDRAPTSIRRECLAGLFIIFDDRPSDSPFVERVWRCHSERAGRFLSVASSHWEMVVTR